MARAPCADRSTVAFNAAMNAIDLASLLCSRLCHDLLSPVGALNNGIELLADEQDPEMRERCLELLARKRPGDAPTSSNSSAWRSAPAGGFGDEIDTREARGRARGPVRPRAADRARLDGRRRQAAQGRGQVAAQPRADRRRCAGPRRPARRRRRALRRRDRDRRSAPRGRASCSIPSFARPCSKARRGDGRAARGRRLAGARLAAEAGGAIQLSDPADEVLMIGATLPLRTFATSGTNAALTPRPA